MREERLRRGQAPLLLPTSVRVGDAEDPSPSALRAIAKRLLYPPAGWLEEMDDRTSVKGRLNITFAGSLPGGGRAVLLLRARRGSRADPVDAGYGPLQPLGHNAGTRGWQPYVLPLALVSLTPDLTLTLNIDAPVSRVLLGRGGAGGP